MNHQAVVKQRAGPGGLALRRRMIREVGSGEALVEVAAAGICGTDLEVWNWPDWLATRMSGRLPVAVGHEFCGFVRQVGADVSTVMEGDFVSVESHVHCGRCPRCARGLEHICDNTQYVGVDIDGGFAEYVVLPISVLRPLPAGIAVHNAALLEPFALATRSVLAEGGVRGHSVLVTGLGPLGLMSMAVACASGAESVIGVESSAFRLALARQFTEHLGAAEVRSTEETDLRARLRRGYGGHGADVWLDFAAAPAALSFGMEVLGRGGQARLLGMPHDAVPVELATAVMKEISMRTFHGRNGPESWQSAIELLADARIDLAPLITHRVSLDEYEKAFELLFRREAGKVLIQIAD